MSPRDEHFNRSPECLFFNFVDPNPAPTKKTARGRTARASKTSRASVQSTGMGTFITEGPSTLDMPAEIEDSVMTTASKRGRTKKAATATKGTRKTRAKKEESVEVEETEVTMDEEVPPPPIPAPAPKTRKSRKPANTAVDDSEVTMGEDEPVVAPKPRRGRKRASEAIEDSVLTAKEAPPAKRRTTRAKAAVNDMVAQQDPDVTDAEAPAAKKPAARKRVRASNTKTTTRKASGTSLRSTASTASLRSEAEGIPDDDEIERQLMADLERPLSDDEDVAMDSDSGRRRNANRTTTKRRTVKAVKEEKPHVDEQGDYAMFDPAPVVPDEAEVEAELDRLEAEARTVVKAPEPPEPELEKLEVPKKGRKAAGTRKASRTTKKTKPAPVPEPAPQTAYEPEPEPQLEPDVQPAPDPVGEHELEPEPIAEPEPEPEPEFVDAPDAHLEAPGETSIYEDAAEPEVAQPLAHDARTVVKDDAPEEVEEEKPAPAKRGRGRPPKKRASRGRSSAASVKQRVSAVAPPPPAPEPEEEIHQSIELSRHEIVDASPAKPKERRQQSEDLVDSEPELVVVPANDSEPTSPTVRPLPQIPSSAAHVAQDAPSTPDSRVSPAVSTRNGVLSPSQSPQSSDAENHPPSSKPTASSRAKRTVLAPMLAAARSTPNRILNSPTKRTVVSSLQSMTAWTNVDLDLILGSPDKKDDKENSVDRLLRKGAELTSPEKKMTVEEWIHHNAEKAEEELKTKCEKLVGKFEGEGMRAMRVLEGLIVE